MRSLHEAILLSNDWALITNLISKKKITITKEDLKQVIKRKVNIECNVDLDITYVQCYVIKAPFNMINHILILDDNGNGNDFKIK